MMSSHGNLALITGPLWGESTGHRWIPLSGPVTESFDGFFDVYTDKVLNKQ